MNKIMFFLLLISSGFTRAQTLSHNETVSYIQDKLKTYGTCVDGENFACTEYGKVEITIFYEDGITQIWTFKLNDMDIMVGKNVDPYGYAMHSADFSCKNGSKCSEFIALKNGQIVNRLTNERHHLSLSSQIESERVVKALKHLQKLVAGKRDPFD